MDELVSPWRDYAILLAEFESMFFGEGDRAVEYGQRMSRYLDDVKDLKYQKVNPTKRDEPRDPAKAVSNGVSPADQRQMLGMLDDLTRSIKPVDVQGSSAMPGRPCNRTLMTC